MFEIGYPLLGIDERAVGRRTHLRTSSGPTFRAGSYRDRHRSPQVVDRDDQLRSANDRYRPVPVSSARSANGRNPPTAADFRTMRDRPPSTRSSHSLVIPFGPPAPSTQR